MSFSKKFLDKLLESAEYYHNYDCLNLYYLGYHYFSNDRKLNYHV